jgi:uncharacterized protein YggE
LVLLASLSASAFAANGRVEIYGKGEVSAKPEQAQITVSVVSLCYDKSRDAVNANAVLADKLVKLMQARTRAPQDKVVATGGQTVRQTEYLYEEGGANRKVLCERKWRASNTLTLKTSALNEVADIQDAILVAIDGAEETRAGVTAQTYAQLSQPSFVLLPGTLTKLRAQAQKDAYADAKAQFENFRSVCPFQNPQLVSVTPPQAVTPMPRFAAPASVEAGGTATPILPDELVVSAQWKFVWEYEPSASCAIY